MSEENWKENAKKRLKSEVEIYDMYLRGDVYGYIVEKKRYFKYLDTNEMGYEWEINESCWGFYSDKYGKDLLKEMCSEIGVDFSKLHEKEMETV